MSVIIIIVIAVLILVGLNSSGRKICYECGAKYSRNNWDYHSGNKEFCSKNCLDDFQEDDNKKPTQISNKTKSNISKIPFVKKQSITTTCSPHRISRDNKSNILDYIHLMIKKGRYDLGGILETTIDDYYEFLEEDYFKYYNLKRKNISTQKMNEIRASIDYFYENYDDGDPTWNHRADYKGKLIDLTDGDMGIKGYKKFYYNYKSQYLSIEKMDEKRKLIEEKYTSPKYTYKDKLKFLNQPDSKNLSRISQCEFPEKIEKKLEFLIEAIDERYNKEYWKDDYYRLKNEYYYEDDFDFFKKRYKQKYDEYYIPPEEKYLDFKWENENEIKRSVSVVMRNQQLFFNMIIFESYLKGIEINYNAVREYLNQLEFKNDYIYKCYILIDVLEFLDTNNEHILLNLIDNDYFILSGIDNHTYRRWNFILHYVLNSKEKIGVKRAIQILKLSNIDKHTLRNVPEIFEGFNDLVNKQVCKIINERKSEINDLLTHTYEDISTIDAFIVNIRYCLVLMDRNTKINRERPLRYEYGIFLVDFFKKFANKNITRTYKNIDKEKISIEFIELCDDIYREAENHVREKNDLPKVGEGWVSETALFNKIKDKYPKYKVRHDYGVSWLKPQRLDVYIDELNIGFEYQGVQHSRPIEFFGGKEAFKKNQERDAKKKRLCEENGCVLVYVYPEDDEDVVNKKIEDAVASVENNA